MLINEQLVMDYRVQTLRASPPSPRWMPHVRQREREMSSVQAAAATSAPATLPLNTVGRVGLRLKST